MKKWILASLVGLSLLFAAAASAVDCPFYVSAAGATVLDTTKNKTLTSINIDSIAGTFASTVQIKLYDDTSATPAGNPVWSASFPVSPTSTILGTPIKLNLKITKGVVFSTSGSPATVTAEVTEDCAGSFFPF